MPSVTTSKPINATQLKSELGGKDVVTRGAIPLSADSKVVDVAGVTAAALEAAIAAHVADVDFGDAQTKDLRSLRTKAQAVFAGTDTFTAAQTQKILAGIILTLTK